MSGGHRNSDDASTKNGAPRTSYNFPGSDDDDAGIGGAGAGAGMGTYVSPRDVTVRVGPYRLGLGPFAQYILSTDPSDPEELKKRFRVYVYFTLGTSVVFWTWAAINTRQMRASSGSGVDLGVASFLGTVLSSACLLRAAHGGRCRDKTRRFGCSCCVARKETKKKNDDGNGDEEGGDVYAGIGNKNDGGKGKGGRDVVDDDRPRHAPPGTCLRTFLLASQTAVVANYLLGLLFAFTAGRSVYVHFATYCATFATLWSLTAYVGWILVAAYRDAVSYTYGRRFLENADRGCDLCTMLIGCLYQMKRGPVVRKRERDDDWSDDESYDDEPDDDEFNAGDDLRALIEGPGYA